MTSKERYWNNKWEKQPVIYQGRTPKNNNNTIRIDVKNFITINDNLLKEVVGKYGLKRATLNETAHACQIFVKNNIKYVGDNVQCGCPEFWQFPFETVATRMGDCEDGAILMASLMINAGIPAWRVKVGAGFVQPEVTAPQGGHAYCLYLADRENGQLDWEIHDWCYYQDTDVPTGKKPLAKEGGYKNTYKDVWFTFNNEYSWSSKLTTVDANRVGK